MKYLYKFLCGSFVGAGLYMLAALGVNAAPLVTCASNASGLWSAGIWSCGHVPAVGDDVIITAGHTVTVTTDTAALASLAINGTLTVGATNGGKDVTVTGNLNIASGGIMQAGNQDNANHQLFLGGDMTNNGSFNGRVTAARVINTRFNGDSNQSVSGSGTTDFNEITVDMNGVQTNVLDITAVITMKDPATMPVGDTLHLEGGTFKLSSASTISPFRNSYTIHAIDGFIVNHPGAVIEWGGTQFPFTVNGNFEMLSGTMTVGDGRDKMEIGSGATANLAGGTLNVNGRFLMEGGSTTTISGTTLNVDPQGSGGNFGGGADAFEARGLANLAVSGGTITVVDPLPVAGNGREFVLVSGNGTKSFTGGTVQMGDGISSTPGSANGFEIIAAGIPLFNFTVANQQGGANRIVNLGEVQGTPTPQDLTLYGSLTIQSGGTLNAAVGAGADISLKGDWTNSGTFTQDNAFVTFFGSAAQSIGGTTTTTFNGLILSNTAADVTAVTSLTVAGALTMNQDTDLALSGSTLTMGTGSAGLTGGTGQGEVVGQVIRTAFVSFNDYNFGSPFVQFGSLSFTGAPTQISVTLAKSSPIGFSTSVRRAYTIAITGGTDVATNLRLHYRDDAFTMNGNSEATLTLWRKDTNWTNVGQDIRNAPQNWVQKNGVDTFSEWTLSSVAPTAVEMVSFTARVKVANVKLRWVTGNEVQLVGFNVWRKQRGDTWRQLNDDVIPANNPGGLNGSAYKFKDLRIAHDSVYSYKIEFLYADGSSERSNKVRVHTVAR